MTEMHSGPQEGHLARTIFWSWQSDRDPVLHHYFVRDALKDACRLIASDIDYQESGRLEVDHDTKNVAGTPDITTTILEKIAKANVFVADMTPVGKTDPLALQPKVSADKRSEPKYLQNPNVMCELGYAEHALTQSRIVLVANSAHYPGAQALPFDWRHRSGAKTYNLKDGATKEEIKIEQKRFSLVLKNLIMPILANQAQPKPPLPPISWQPSSSLDQAIWPAATEKLEYRNTAMGDLQQKVAFPNGTRIFARIAPREWSPPARFDLVNRVSEVGLKIRGQSGDWGVNSDGALSVWGTITRPNNELVATSATQWFHSNGELWAINCDCFSEYEGGLVFAYRLPFPPLDDFLRKGVNAIKMMGGKGPIGIKLGAADLTGTVMPGGYPSQRRSSVCPRADAGGELESWTQDERRGLLFKFWNALLDAYALPPSPSLLDFQNSVGLAPLST